MIGYLSRRLHRRRDDDGFAMMSVLFFLLIVSILGTGIAALSINFTRSSKHESSYQDALSAAEAGVDDYLDRLNADYNYGTDVSFSAGVASDGNTALKQYGCKPGSSGCTAPAGSSSCVNPVTDGASVSVGYPGYYCYWVVNKHVVANAAQDNQYGTLYLYTRGEVNGVTRTLRIGLKPYGFLDALSSSDYNLVDPALQQGTYNNAPLSVAQTIADCQYHAYDANPESGGRGPDMGKCYGLINYWITGNDFKGPMQSNDEFYLCGTPNFEDHVYSGDPNSSDAPYWTDPAGCGGDNPTFADDGGTIQGNNQVVFPPAASTIKTQDTVIGQAGSGCLYTGPTSITLSGKTMSVYSPETKTTNPGCLGANVSVPPNGTIYVQNQPSSSSDVNYSAVPCLSTSFPVLATTTTVTPDTCNEGDAFVQGNTSQQLTIAADNDVYITGNLTYTDPNAQNPRPVLGLIANNTIEVLHPVSNLNCGSHPMYNGYCNYYGTTKFDLAGDATYTSPIVNPTIDAAMLSLQHSFAVQNFTVGTFSDLGNVNLDGAVAGKFMDIEGTFSGNTQVSGYGVNYVYDKRFENGSLVPPNFLDPTQTFWHRVSYAECSANTSTCPTSS